MNARLRRLSPVVVMPGLDPGIHSVAPASSRDGHGMDCRVKPGNDDKWRGVGKLDARPSPLLDDHQRLAIFHRLAVLHQDGDHLAGARRGDLVHVLHGFDDEDRLADADRRRRLPRRASPWDRTRDRRCRPSATARSPDGAPGRRAISAVPRRPARAEVRPAPGLRRKSPASEPARHGARRGCENRPARSRSPTAPSP